MRTVKEKNLLNIKIDKPLLSVRIDWLILIMIFPILSPGILKYGLFVGALLSMHEYELKK